MSFSKDSNESPTDEKKRLLDEPGKALAQTGPFVRLDDRLNVVWRINHPIEVQEERALLEVLELNRRLSDRKSSHRRDCLRSPSHDFR